MAEDKNIKDKKTKLDGSAASSKDAKQETSGIKKKLKVKKKRKEKCNKWKCLRKRNF